MSTGVVMIEVHAEIIRTHPRRGQRGPEFMQSTDQALHHGCLLVAALITAGGRRGLSGPNPTSCEPSWRA
jgi:hypothetical protein